MSCPSFLCVIYLEEIHAQHGIPVCNKFGNGRETQGILEADLATMISAKTMSVKSRKTFLYIHFLMLSR